MEPRDPDVEYVRFSVKDLIAQLHGKVDLINQSLALKADQAKVDDLHHRLRDVETQVRLAELPTMKRDVAALREGAATQAAVDRWKRRFFGGSVVASASVAVAIWEAIR